MTTPYHTFDCAPQQKLTMVVRCGSGMAQHQPVARIEALYRNGWPGSAIKPVLSASNRLGDLCPPAGRAAGLVRTAPKTDYRSRVANGVDSAYFESVVTIGIIDGH